MVRNVRDGRTFDPHRRVVPADLAPRGVLRGVEWVTTVERQVDAADERHLVVDHDDLLVVRVLEPDARVGLCLDLRRTGEDLHVRLDLPLRRPEDGDRSSLPHEQPHVDTTGDIRKQVPEDDGLLLPGQVQLGRKAPAEKVHVGLRAGDRVGDGGEIGRAVDQDLDAVPASRLECRPAREPELVSDEDMLPADLAEPPTMVRGHRALHALAHGVGDRPGGDLQLWPRPLSRRSLTRRPYPPVPSPDRAIRRQPRRGPKPSAWRRWIP